MTLISVTPAPPFVYRTFPFVTLFTHQQHLLCLESSITCSGEKTDIRLPPSVRTYIPLVGTTLRTPTSVSWPSPHTSSILSSISPESHPQYHGTDELWR